MVRRFLCRDVGRDAAPGKDLRLADASLKERADLEQPVNPAKDAESWRAYRRPHSSPRSRRGCRRGHAGRPAADEFMLRRPARLTALWPASSHPPPIPDAERPFEVLWSVDLLVLRDTGRVTAAFADEHIRAGARTGRAAQRR